jgi:competence protein ComEC
MKLNLYAILFGVGVYLVWFLPILPNLYFLFFTIPLACIGLKFPRLVPLGYFLLGLGWGIYQCHNISNSQVPIAPQGVDAHVVGVVSSIPQDRGISQRFEFRLESYQLASDPIVTHLPKKVLISWYSWQDQLLVGDRLGLEVRLRRPRGLSNFGQFDYRRWLLGNGIDATGYVRSGIKLGVSDSWIDRINRYRFQVFESLGEIGLRNPELISALGLGIQSEIEQDQWDLFTRTGVIHLMIISGLHIGFSGLIGFYIGGLVSKPLLWLGLLQGDMLPRAVAAIMFASFYAILAGLSLPVLRALILLLILLLSRALKLNWSGWTVLSLAFAVIAFLDPIAVLQSGFWMSFGAVAVLVVSLSGRAKQGGFMGLIRAQIMLLSGFGGLLLYLGKPLYFSGFMANLVAVPFTGIVLVPLILSGMLLLPFMPKLSELLLKLADMGLELLLEFLRILSQLPLPVIQPSSWPVAIGLLICATGILLVAVPSIYLRLGLSSILLPLVLGIKTETPEFSLLVFDVGQGTAVLIEQSGYRLLYDTGPAFSPQFNAGADILHPHLSKTSTHLDALVVSHDDSDHSGGLFPILNSMVIDEIYVGGSRIFESGVDVSAVHCSAGHTWQVGQVRYSFLHPPDGDRQRFNETTSDNNQPCVLLIEFAGNRILLAGDIEKTVEFQILEIYPTLANVDLLLVPHHGSGTSSSQSFLSRLSPEIAIVSAGYGNSFGHPRKDVRERYNQVGSELYSTAEQGALLFEWSSLTGNNTLRASRSIYRYWWQE